MKLRPFALPALVVASSVLFGSVARPDADAAAEVSQAHREAREEPFVKRPFLPFRGERWVGNAVAYGPYRDGQFPGGPSPTRAQIREDLRLLSQHWSLLRLYGAVGPAESVLAVIREDTLDMQVMLGMWIGSEERRNEGGGLVEQFPETRKANRLEIEAAVGLAAEYPEIVIALCVGNETQVFWSDHRVPADLLTAYVRQVRRRTRVPVTVADDFNFWNKPESRALAREIDFIVTHIHPLWNSIGLEDAVDWTWKTFAEIQSLHPRYTVVLGETGWATQKHDEGEQARLIKGQPGEEQQAQFHRAMTAAAERQRIPLFFFEAFDENWKGGAHADEVEKHWGLFRADRTPKKALAHEK